MANKLFQKNCICCNRAVNHSADIFCRRCLNEIYREEAPVKNGSGIITLLPYTKPQVRALILYMKDHCDPDAFSFCASLVAHKLVSLGIHSLDSYCVTFAPRKPLSRLLCGFDQSEKIALHLALEISGDKRQCMKLVHRRLFSKEQKLLDSANRESSMKQSLSLKAGIQIPKNIIVIDDITTTGATLHRILSLLTENGAENCIPIAIAYNEQ